MNFFKKLSLMTLTATVLTAGGFLWLASPQAADAFGTCFPCTSGPTYTTGPVTGTSTYDCAWAEMEAKSDLRAQASCDNGFCVENFITTSACQWTAGTYRVGLKLEFRCEECINPD